MVQRLSVAELAYSLWVDCAALPELALGPAGHSWACFSPLGPARAYLGPCLGPLAVSSCTHVCFHSVRLNESLTEWRCSPVSKLTRLRHLSQSPFSPVPAQFCMFCRFLHRLATLALLTGRVVFQSVIAHNLNRIRVSESHGLNRSLGREAHRVPPSLAAPGDREGDEKSLTT